MTDTPNDQIGLPSDMERSGRVGNAAGSSVLQHGHLLLAQASATGHADLLDQAIAILESALNDGPRAAALLGTALIARYELNQHSPDLERAISLLRAADSALAPGDPVLGDIRSNLGAALRDRFQLTQDPKDADSVIEALAAALDVTPSESPGRMATLSMLALALLDRFRATHNLADVSAAVATATQAAALPAAASDWRAAYNLSACLCERYRVTHAQQDVDDGIDAAGKALRLIPPGHSDRLIVMLDLARALHDRYDLTGSDADLGHATAIWTQLATAAPQEQASRLLDSLLATASAAERVPHAGRRTALLAAAATVGWERAESSATREALDRAGELWMLAVHTFTTGVATNPAVADVSHSQAARCVAPAEALLRAARTGTGLASGDFGKALDRLAALVDVEQDPLPAQLTGVGYLLRSTAVASPALQGRCIVQALLLLRPLARRGGPIPRQLAEVYRHNRRWLTDDWRACLASDANAMTVDDDSLLTRSIAIELLRATTTLPATMGRSHPEGCDLARLEFENLSNLGVFLRVRAEDTRSTGDVSEALDIARRCTNHPSASPQERPSLELNLSLAHRDRFRLEGSAEDGRSWLAHAREAVGHLGPDDSRRTVVVQNLVTAWRSVPAHGAAGDCLEEILQATVVEDGDCPPELQATRASALLTRYDRDGAATDLDEAIALLRQLVKDPHESAGERAGQLSNLATALVRRFDAIGATADAEEGLAAARQAVELAPPDDPDAAMYLSNLGLLALAHGQRFGGSSAERDLAIETARKGLTATPANSESFAAHLSNLALCLLDRGAQAPADPPQATSRSADLLEAMDLAERAVVISQGRPDAALHLANAAAAAWSLYRASPSSAAAETVITRCGEALQVHGTGDASRAGVLVALAEVLAKRRGPGDLARSSASAQEAALIETAPASIRVRAALAWAETAEEAGDWPQVCRACDVAADITEHTVTYLGNRLDVERAVARLAGLPSRAAAAHLMLDDPEGAAVAFERTHAALLARQLGTRQELRALERLRPDLAQEYRTVTARLAAHDRYEVVPGWAGSLDFGHERETLLTRRSALRDSIRSIDGFASFDGAGAPVDLRGVASACPVVLFSIAEARSDALVLTPSGVTAVRLPEVTPLLVQEKAALMWGAVDDAQKDITGLGSPTWGEHALSDVLSWLWDAVTAPVLAALGLDAPVRGNGPWPHICWCPSGHLSLLPLHAAGRHQGEPGAGSCSVMDCVVSSYTATVGALLGPPASAASPEPPNDLVVIAMSTTPGAADLPGAAIEAQTVLALVGGHVQLLGTVDNGSPATAESVLSALATSRWAHFACHAAGDLARPSAGCLLLSHPAGGLTIRDLLAADLQGADLAYLSACATGRPAAALLDEVVDLASAFSTVGYRHVVATLWPVGDRSAQFVSERFYRTLLCLGGDPRGAAVWSAAALHDAVRALRDLLPHRPSKWAAHVHVGPSTARPSSITVTT